MSFIFKSRTKSALFTKRTLKLFFPIPLIFFMVNGTASRGVGNFFSAPLSAQFVDPTSFPIYLLSNVLNHRILPSSIQDHGDLFIYKPYYYDDEEYEVDENEIHLIESVNSFNSLKYGPDFSFKPVTFAVTQDNLSQITLISKQQSQPTTPIFFIEPTSRDSVSSSIAKYRWQKSNFVESDLDRKSDLNLVADLKVSTNAGDFSFAISIDLANLIANTEQEFVILSSSKKNGKDKTTFSFKFSRETSSNSLIIELLKKDEESSPINKVDVIKFYFVFSDNPPLPYSQIFEEQTPTASDSFTYSQAKVKQIFLDKWTNKTNGIQHARRKRSTDEPGTSQFSFSAQDDFWKSVCSDPYKVGGFIDEDPNKQKATSSSTQQSLKDSDTYVKQQLSLYENFDPIKYSSRTGGFQTIYPYTSSTPCKDLDEETKTLLQEYAKPKDENGSKPSQQLTKEASDYIKWSLTPQPIKDLLGNGDQQQTSKSKVIQSSFRAWGGSYASNYQDAQKRGIYNSLYEQANQSTHTFEVTIDKQTVETSLIDHEKLKAKDDKKKEKSLNQLPEISSQIQVSIPYSLIIYDPVSNFLKKQWVNLSVALDLRSIYNQSQYIKEFFVYDMAVNNSRIGTDYSGYSYGTSNKAKNYGLSGTISFSAGLYLDVTGDLKIQLITQIKGFVNTKNPTCDLRQRKYKFNGNKENSNPTCGDSNNNWSYRKHNHIPSFIVLEIHEDPKISSFYLDRRVSTSSTEEETTQSSGKDDNIETLSDFKDRKLKQPERTIVRTMDQTNNGEVYFEKLDVTDPRSPELQKATSVRINDGKGIDLETKSGSWLSSAEYGFTTYYVPRRNYGEIVIEDHSNLNEITIHAKGSTALGGDFLQSMHYGTKVTYCTSEKEITKVTSNDKQCGDGTKYEKIEKDKTTPEFKGHKSQQVKISFDDLKKATSDSNAKKFNFLTVIHRPKNETKGKDSNEFESTKTKLEFLFKESDGFKKDSKDKNKFPSYSLVGVWYTLEMWWDSNNKKLCYYTKVRAISSVSSVTKKSTTLENSDAHKVVGASARAGFELSKMEFKYKKQAS